MRALSIYPNVAHKDDFAELLTTAQVEGAGMWGACPTAAGVQLGHFQGEVEVPKLVVSSPPVAAGYGFYVQDPGGGPWSGLFVYTGEAEADVEVGDLLTVQGATQEYYGATQLVAESWTRTDDDWVESAWLDRPQSDWEPWDGVLVEARSVEITGQGEQGLETDLGLVLGEDFTVLSLEVGDRVDVEGIIHTAWDTWYLSPRSAEDLD